MLSNAYFLEKFRFGTAENEPAKNLQNMCKFCQYVGPTSSGAGAARGLGGAALPPAGAGPGLRGREAAVHAGRHARARGGLLEGAVPLGSK